MRVIDRITAERLTVDQAYERFFDGFYNLGRPEEIFAGTVIFSSPKTRPLAAALPPKPRRSGRLGRPSKRLARRK